MFDKVLLITDAHFGRKNNCPIACQDNLEFLQWAVDRAKSWGAKQCFMLGDWFDNRHSIGVGSMDAALKGLQMLSSGFDKTWAVTGNHDQFYKHNRNITSMEFAKHITNISIVNNPLTLDDVTFLPWLLHNEHKTLNLSSSKYVFAHLELAGFAMNGKHIMPENDSSQKIEMFKNQNMVFTGHFHQRQIFKNVFYIGNIIPFDFSDDGDSNKGIVLLKYGNDPIFEAWPDQPLYRTVKMSELLENPGSILKPKMTVRATVDIQLQFEDAQDIRDALETEYGIRKIELIHTATADESDQEFKTDVEFKSVDQMVLDGIQSIESIDISPVRLAEIYRSLG